MAPRQSYAPLPWTSRWCRWHSVHKEIYTTWNTHDKYFLFLMTNWRLNFLYLCCNVYLLCHLSFLKLCCDGFTEPQKAPSMLRCCFACLLFDANRLIFAHCLWLYNMFRCVHVHHWCVLIIMKEFTFPILTLTFTSKSDEVSKFSVSLEKWIFFFWIKKFLFS